MSKHKRSARTKPTPATSTPEAGLFASMSSKNHIANSTPDDWRHALAWRVRELVSTPERMGIFRDRLKDWFKEELARFYQEGNEDTGRVSLPLPLKDCEPPLVEKFAILAALHDVALSQSGVDPIVIVDLQSSTSGAKLSEQNVGAINFIQLFKQIPKMPKRYQPALEKYLVDVCADLKVPVPVAASEESPGRATSKELPELATARGIAKFFGWSAGRVRSELAKAYYGPGGAGVGKPAHGKAQWRVTVPNAGGSKPKYLWNTLLVIPYLKDIF